MYTVRYNIKLLLFLRKFALFGLKDKYKIGRPARLENSLAGSSSGTVILPIADVQCLPSARGQEVAPPPLPREGVNNSIQDEISRDAKHVGETRRCTRRGATRRARRVSSGIVTRRRLTAWNNKFYCYIFFIYTYKDKMIRTTRTRRSVHAHRS